MVRVAYVSTYPPRQCGIASFIGDLSRVTPDREIVALHPLEPIGQYAFEVHHRIRRDEPDDYSRVARSLERCADLAAIQLADGIWGGTDGESVLDFLRALRLPSTATLHSLPHDPSARQREILAEVIETAHTTIVMAQAAATLLTETYGVASERVAVLPYGVPDLPVLAAESVKPSLSVEGRDVILSFGLLAPRKGYELMIDALPAVLKTHPKAMYVIVGATHPDVRLRDGEAYRISLASRAAALGIADHVRFVPEFVGRAELVRWLQAADVFVTPTPDLDTMVSGTLSYAMAAGRAIVSTSYPFASELLADDRGVLVKPGAGALAKGVLGLLDDVPARLAMGARAHAYSRPMVWNQVGKTYQALFTRVAAEAPGTHSGQPRGKRPLTATITN